MLNLKKVHIIGIGGCASSAIAEYLVKNNIIVTGSEQKKREDLKYLENLNIQIEYNHKKENLYINNIKPDIVLYSPAVFSLNPNNPEIKEAKERDIPLLSWQQFIGEYFHSKGYNGITVSGSEGKGTTAGILTMILKGTEFDPLSILGAKLKNINGENSNIYIGKGKCFILEGDEFNRNFYNYRPSINITINFQFEHPETYKDFNDYQDAFYNFFSQMKEPKILILKATETLKKFIRKYNLESTHKIIWFGTEEEIKEIKSENIAIITDYKISINGISFILIYKDKKYPFELKFLPGYIINNATGAIIAAFELGLDFEIIKKNINNFTGMVRRFELFKTKNNGIIITDYGHSPESLNHIIKEIRLLFPDKKLHTVFQPHLFSRTYNFFHEFIEALKKSDRVSLIDVYPAREKEEEWIDKVSSYKIYEELKKSGCSVYYAGKSSDIYKNLFPYINENEITCFIGAGDMDRYYGEILKELDAKDFWD
ncbi:MAG TPA: cyanophycin synthetase [Spirochaetota bacterium]|nr:cyanophycin synthetase [Spirochaetota bacterium]HOL57429.1 cyanophycin synthetase [Spirochaetota bacterium]HPP04997.1 cyanophycin synthetase [Spirochaetota bacterium]